MLLRLLVERVVLCLLLALVSVHVRAEEFACGSHSSEMVLAGQHDIDTGHGHDDGADVPDHKSVGHGSCCFAYACCVGVFADLSLPERPRMPMLYWNELAVATAGGGPQPLSPPPKST